MVMMMVMVMVSSTLSFPPFFSPLPSPTPSRLVCYAFPKSRSQSDRPNPRHKPHWKGKHQKADAISDQEAIHRFDQLLAAKNIRQINNYLKNYTKTSNNPYPTIFFLFTCLTQAQGISPNEYTYGILMDSCVLMSQLSLIFVFLGRFLREGHRPHAVIFSPIIKGLCWDKRTDEAVNVVLNKMPNLGCLPDVFSYNILIDGFCKKGENDKAMDIVDIMISKGHDPNIVTYNTLIKRLCNKGKTDKALDIVDVMISKGYDHDVVTYTTLTNSLRKSGETGKALDFVNVMISKGDQPNVVTYNTYKRAMQER